MRKFWMLAVTALAAALWLPAAAQAQGNNYTYPKTQYGNWKVYGMTTNCWMTHQQPVDGTILSFAVSSQRSNVYFGFENRSWTQFESYKKYDITVQFGATPTHAVGTAVIDEQLGPVMIAFFPVGDLFPMLRSSHRARVTLGNKTLFDLDLDPGADAIDDFEACARELKAGPYKS